MKTVKKGTIRSRIKRGDQVVFVAGREYNRYDSNGKRTPFRGAVIAVDPVKGKVKVEGAMIAKRHKKAVPQMNIEGGIIEQEAWVDISNVAHVDPETGKPTRVRYEERDGKKVRVAKSGKLISEPERRLNTKKATGENEG
jgi:large subunit ribosomal protein L24